MVEVPELRDALGEGTQWALLDLRAGAHDGGPRLRLLPSAAVAQ